MSSDTKSDVFEPGSWEAARERAQKLIEQRDFDGAIDVLKEVNDDPDGQVSSLLGLAYFRKEDYAEAASQLELALAHQPGNQDWENLHTQANSNLTSAVNVPVPPFYFFDKDALLAPPADASYLPPSPPPPANPGWIYRVYLVIGNVTGALASVVMGATTTAFGSIFGYRDRIWTNWYRRNLFFGILTLAYMREKLNKHNLKNTYPDGTLIGFQKPGQNPPDGATHYRTADGSWNNLSNPKEGAAGTRFPRNVDNAAIRPAADDEIMTPNPREISRKLLTRTGPMKEVPFLNLLAASWIQFQNHDWVNHGEVVLEKPFEIPLEQDDPARTKYRQSKMFVGRTQPDPTRDAGGKEKTPLTYINEVTHWWDGSQLYGSDQQTMDRLRNHIDGKLALTPEQTLPIGNGGVEDTGFVRNWWIGLSMLHTLFAREHNAICDHLKVSYPHWNDERLFQVARLINAAVMAKIHTVEWTPAILPNKGLDAALNANWFGIATNLFKSGKHRKTIANINIKNPELGGVVANPINKHGQPYGLTQEFVEVYRLHSLLPESLQIRRLGDSTDGECESLPLPDTRQAASPKITARIPMSDLFFSFGNQLPGQLVLNNFPAFMQEISVPGNPIFDLGAVDILRARERGVPRYNEFRRQLGLHPITCFEDLTDDREQVAKLKEVYGNQPADVEKLDLMIGTLSESQSRRPDKFGFGETMFQIFILNATRRLQADRFYTDNYDEATYTREGLQWIDNSDFKTVLLRHYPELAKTGLANVKNAFEPWDTDRELNPDRHPLRAYSTELRDNPWLGDSYR